MTKQKLWNVTRAYLEHVNHALEDLYDTSIEDLTTDDLHQFNKMALTTVAELTEAAQVYEMENE